MTTYEDQTTSGPSDYHAVGLATLLRESVAGNDLASFGEHLVKYTQQHDDAEAWLDLSFVLQMKLEPELAMAAQAQALNMRKLYRTQSARHARNAARILALKAPGDLMANTPFECLTEGADIQIDTLYVDASTPPETHLPEHDVVIVAGCANDQNLAVLERIERMLQESPRPVLNRPEHIRLTEREAACQRLGSIAGLTMARTARLTRAELQAAASSLDVENRIQHALPIIIRPVGSHAGRGLERIQSTAQLTDYLIQSDAGIRSFYIAPFIDYSDGDGLYRKYRIVLIEGRPYLCHMGISNHWMVHYPYSEMIDHPQRRDEEARMMATFDTGFVGRHGDAFRAMCERIPLDYWGMDCAETHDGRLLVFEVATGMVIHDMDDHATFPYKRPQIQHVRQAFNDMLIRAAEKQQ